MLKKILSGGQAGAEKAALDTADKFGIMHGSWVSKQRLNETENLHVRDKMQKLQADRSPSPTKRNVVDSDGTLIISNGPLTGRSKYTKKIALHHHKPLIHIDLNEIDISDASYLVNDWIIRERIQTLNVTGPSATKDQNIYQDTVELLMKVISIMKSSRRKGTQ